jgi:uncharacterized protein
MNVTPGSLEPNPVLSPARRDLASAAFFDAAEQKRLLIKRCPACGAATTAAAGACTACQCRELRTEFAIGTGSLIAWTAVAFSSTPGGTPSPVTSGLVELDEGPWIAARLTVATNRLAVGLPVVAAFSRSGDEFVPTFGEATG